MLRGKFSAALTRTSAADYTQVSHRNISGSFVVAAPWKGDRDIKINRSSSSDAAIQDLAEVIPILGTLDLSVPIKSGQRAPMRLKARRLSVKPRRSPVELHMPAA